jgi:glutathione S-transferase
MPTLYQDSRSGNCHKVVMTAAYLGLPLKTVEIDVVAGLTRTPAFLAKNPNGRVPALELDDGRILPESNAIVWYLAEGSDLIPQDRFARGQMLQWMFFEQYSHEPYIAVARFWLKFAPKDKLREKEHLIPEWHAKGNAALGVMEDRLRQRSWFVGERYSLADIALFAYTHNANEAGFDLSKYPAVEAWLARVRATKNFVPMKVS